MRYTEDEKKLFENIKTELNFFLRAYAIVDSLERACNSKNKTKAGKLLKRLKRVEFREQWRASAHKISKEINKILPQFDKMDQYELKDLERSLKIYEGKLLLATHSLGKQLEARNLPLDEYWTYIAKELKELKTDLRAVALTNKNVTKRMAAKYSTSNYEEDMLKDEIPKIIWWANNAEKVFKDGYEHMGLRYKRLNIEFDRTELVDALHELREMNRLWGLSDEWIAIYNHEVKKALAYLSKDLNSERRLKELIPKADILEIGILDKKINYFEKLIRRSIARPIRSNSIKTMEFYEKFMLSFLHASELAKEIGVIFNKIKQERSR